MRNQLAKFLNTDPYNFLSIDCAAGSIIINFELVASDDVTAAQLSDAYNELVVYLENGFLQLVIMHRIVNEPHHKQCNLLYSNLSHC